MGKNACVSEGIPDAWAPAILCNSTLILISRGSGSEDEILQEVAPREAKNGSRALGGEEQQEGEGGNGGSHVYPEGSAERESPGQGDEYWRCRHSAGCWFASLHARFGACVVCGGGALLPTPDNATVRVVSLAASS